MGLRGGIDLGGTKIQAVVVGARNGARGQARIPTPKDGGPDGVIAAMAEAIRAAAEEAKVETSALDGVGIGSPGEVDTSAGTVTNAYNVVPDWNRTIQVGDILGKELGTRIGLGNDVRVATTAEFELGAGKPYCSLLGVFWGTGVGGGIILNGGPGAAAAPPARSATWSSAATGRSARAAARAAWRPIPGGGRWSSRPGGG